MFEIKSSHYDVAVVEMDHDESGVCSITVVYFDLMNSYEDMKITRDNDGNLVFSEPRLIKVTNKIARDGLIDFYPVDIEGIGVTSVEFDDENITEKNLRLILTSMNYSLAETVKLIILSDESELEELQNLFFNTVDSDKLKLIWSSKVVIREGALEGPIDLPEWVTPEYSRDRALVIAAKVQIQHAFGK